MPVGKALERSEEALQRVNLALSAFRGSDQGLDFILEHAEFAYLESYVAYRIATGGKRELHAAHEKAKEFRNKLHEVKKLLDELDCEGDRLLQSVHSLRT